MMQKQAIGGWTAAQNGLQPGRNVEYVVEQIQLQSGGTFRSVTFYKPYQSKKPEKLGQWERSFSFRIEDHAELIERINDMLQKFSNANGRYAFQPNANVQTQQSPIQQPPQQQPQPTQQGFVNPNPNSYTNNGW